VLCRPAQTSAQSIECGDALRLACSVVWLKPLTLPCGEWEDLLRVVQVAVACAAVCYGVWCGKGTSHGPELRCGKGCVGVAGMDPTSCMLLLLPGWQECSWRTSGMQHAPATRICNGHVKDMWICHASLLLYTRPHCKPAKELLSTPAYRCWDWQKC
jgi:hypothetical protein